MRIISGKHARKHIVAPSNLPVRPTTDFAKEGLFNVLGNVWDFEGLRVLDLFSGTGNIAYEFACRDATIVFAVDQHKKCVRFIEKMGDQLELHNLVAIQGDALRYIKQTKRTFDIVFADPPYDMSGIDLIPELVFEHNLLNPGGWFILEHSKGVEFPDKSRLIDTRKYGKVHFSIFEMPDKADDSSEAED